MIIMIFILFMLLFLLPFLPGLIELTRKEDAEPLFISMDYIRNPRYFGRSFKQIFHKATAGFTLSPGMREVKLSKTERLELINFLDVSEGREINHMLFVMGNLSSGSGARFNKEILVTGDADIGPENMIQAMAGQGNVSISKRSIIRRWLDADGYIHVGAECNLGISVSSGNALSVARNCAFRRLYGMPVVTGEYDKEDAKEEKPPSFPESVPSPSSFVRMKDSFLMPGTISHDNIVFTRDVLIGSGSLLKGSVKCYGKIVLQDNVTIEGNLIADGDIIVGPNAKIGGHIFSQMSVHISENTVCSAPERIKSVIGKRSIDIDRNVVIYGYITTEGEGKTI